MFGFQAAHFGMLRDNGLPKKYTCMIIKVFSSIGRIKEAFPVLTAPLLHPRMALQVVNQAGSHDLSLRYQGYTGW